MTHTEAQEFLSAAIDGLFLISLAYFVLSLIVFLIGKWNKLDAVAIVFEADEWIGLKPDPELEELSETPVDNGDANDLPSFDEELEELSETTIVTIELPQTLKALKAIATELKIAGRSKLTTKTQLVEAIRAAA